MDRPSRKTKTVNYNESKDFVDDDEDFACAKPPPSKKVKETMKQQDNRKSSKSSSQDTNSQSVTSQKNRQPLDVKLFERDLEAAISLSMLNSSFEISDQSPASKEDAIVQNQVDENTDPSSAHLSNCIVDVTRLGLDQIILEQDFPAPTRQRKESANVQIKSKNQDVDYQPNAATDSESDNDYSEPESEDEEFTVKKAIKTKKEKVAKKGIPKQPQSTKKEKQPRTPKSAVASTPTRTPLTTKNAPGPTKSTPSSKTSITKPASSLSPAVNKIPKWNPPGQIGTSPSSSQSPSVRSPGQGLRLGLSRLVRVKPLHPSVASH